MKCYFLSDFLKYVMVCEFYLHLRHRFTSQHGLIHNTGTSQQHHITWNQYIRILRSPCGQFKKEPVIILLHNYCKFFGKLPLNSHVLCRYLLLGTNKHNEQCVVQENIHTSPMEGFFRLNPPSPLEFSYFFHTFPYKFWLLRPPFPLGISNDLPWGGYGYFLEPHIINLEMGPGKRQGKTGNKTKGPERHLLSLHAGEKKIIYYRQLSLPIEQISPGRSSELKIGLHFLCL